jgi:acetyl-CoA carboxylase biotin carboxyl carrier protein
MTTSEIAQLARIMAERGVVRVGIDTRGERYVLVVACATTADAAREVHAGPPKGAFATATVPGRFRAAHPVRRAHEVASGAAVKAGQILGFLEAGDLVLPILAPQDGTVGETLALDGALVGYGTPLMRLSR